MNPIKYKGVIINCNNLKCGYTEEVEVQDRNFLKSYINKPCPKCGQVMFSQEDFDNTEKIYELLDTILPQESISEDMPQENIIKIGVHFQDGKCKGININFDEIQAVEKDEKNCIKPIPNSQIFESQKKLDEIQRKVNFYLEVQKIESQIPIEQKIEWLIDAQEILSIKN